MDKISKKQRSFTMSKVKSKNTDIEIKVRKFLFSKGLRYRLHGTISRKICPKGYLPGKPDLVFKQHKAVVFVHGCFWHGHNCNPNRKLPENNKYYWENKIHNNMLRDNRNYEEIKKLGYKVLVIWGCETNDKMKLTNLYQNIICDSTN